MGLWNNFFGRKQTKIVDQVADESPAQSKQNVTLPNRSKQSPPVNRQVDCRSLIFMLRSGQPQQRIASARKLGAIKANEAIGDLEEALTSSYVSVELRKTAASALGVIGDASVIPTLVKHFDDDKLQPEVAEALVTLGWAPTNNFQRVRLAVASDTSQYLQELKDSATPFLLEMLLSSNQILRTRAISALSDVGGSLAVSALIEVVHRELSELMPSKQSENQSNHIVTQIVQALGRLRDESAIPALLRTALTIPSLWAECSKSLCLISHKWGATSLAQSQVQSLLKEPCRKEAQITMAEILSEIAGPVATKALYERLIHPKKEVRIYAAMALKRRSWQPATIMEKANYSLACEEWNMLHDIIQDAGNHTVELSDLLLSYSKIADHDRKTLCELDCLLALLGTDQAVSKILSSFRYSESKPDPAIGILIKDHPQRVIQRIMDITNSDEVSRGLSLAMELNKYDHNAGKPLLPKLIIRCIRKRHSCGLNLLQVACKAIGLPGEFGEDAIDALDITVYHDIPSAKYIDEEVSIKEGDTATVRLTRVKHDVASCVLEMVAALPNPTVSLSRCSGYQPSIVRVIDLSRRREVAKKELRRRGFSDRPVYESLFGKD